MGFSPFSHKLFAKNFPDSSAGKEPAKWETWVQSLLGRSPGEGKGCPLRYSGLENSRDCIVRGVAESDTTELLSLSYYIYTFIVVFSLSGVRLFATTWAVD